MFETKKQTAMERDAYALTQTKEVLVDFPVLEWERFTNDPDNMGYDQILIGFDSYRDDWFSELTLMRCKSGTFAQFTGVGETLDRSIDDLSKQVRVWNEYFNVTPISMRDVLDSEDGSFFHSKYDKTHICVKYKVYVFYLKYDITLKEFDVFRKDLINPENEDWDTMSHLVPFKDFRDVIDTLLELWISKDSISDWRFIYPKSTINQNIFTTNYRSLRDLNGDIFFLYDERLDMEEKLDDISNFIKNTPF